MTREYLWVILTTCKNTSAECCGAENYVFSASVLLFFIILAPGSSSIFIKQIILAPALDYQNSFGSIGSIYCAETLLRYDNVSSWISTGIMENAVPLMITGMSQYPVPALCISVAEPEPPGAAT